jgi:hypothetical protein
MKTLPGIIAVCIVTSWSLVSRADSIYSIGNSLTNDALPNNLDGNVDYHIYSSRNLQYIFDHPTEQSSTTTYSSLPWETAFSTNQYDWITVQPFSGTTLQQDVAVISHWMDMQPNANFVIHPAWTAFASFPSDYEAGNPDDNMRPSPEYIADLTAALETQHPGREIVSTRSNDLLYSIHLDIESDIGPFESLADIGRDYVHMDRQIGRYLMHNALRISTGQETTSSGFVIDDEMKSYLDTKLALVPEPNLALLAFSVLVFGFAAHRRRKR